MKIRSSKVKPEQATVLVVTMLICAIIGIMMASYLGMVKTQHYSVARSQSWNTSLVVAEAGIEEALAHLNAFGVATNNLAINNYWRKFIVNGVIVDGDYCKTNFLPNSSNYYIAHIKVPPLVTNMDPMIVSTGFVAGPLSSARLSRAVVVNTKAKPSQSIEGALVVATTLNFNGQGVTTDSFDSRTNAYSTDGFYDPAKIKSRGDVKTLSSDPNAMHVDNGTIVGSVHTGPGGNPHVGAQGVIGDSNYVANLNNKGTIQNAHFKDDMTDTLPENVVPSGKTYLVPVAGTWSILDPTTGENKVYKYLLNGGGAYKMPIIDGSVYVNGKNVTLWVTGDPLNPNDGVTLGTTDEIRIPMGADGVPNNLDVYMSAPKADFGGNGFVNDTGQAKNLRYIGLPSNTYLKFTSNGKFFGQINAPQADFTMSGGGNETYDFVGSSITKSVVFNGHYHFHYDEALIDYRAPSGYKAVSWEEVTK